MSERLPSCTKSCGRSTRSYIAAAVMLITPWVLHADFVPGLGDTYVEQGTLFPSFTTGPECSSYPCEPGWEYSVYIDDSGNVTFLSQYDSGPVNWTGFNFTAPLPALPVDDAYTTATVSFALEPSPYPNYSSGFTGASIGDGCNWAPATISPFGTADAIFQIPAAPCNPGSGFLLQAEGSSSAYPPWPGPFPGPGRYSGSEFYPPPTIDYTVTLHYADPVPEPSYLAAIGLGLVTLICFRNRERRIVK